MAKTSSQAGQAVQEVVVTGRLVVIEITWLTLFLQKQGLREYTSDPRRRE